MTSVNIPMEVAYTVSQNTNSRIHTEKSREYIGSITFGPSSPIGLSATFKMSPVGLLGTRLASIASNYQKFRFRSMALTLQSSTTTGTNGLYIVGYSANPEFALSNASGIINQVFAMPGAQSSNIWRTTTSHAKIEDRSKWYNVDEDSTEFMTTTQGYFVIVLQSPPTTTAPVVFPVILDYDIEFSGQAIQDVNSILIQQFPAGTFTGITGSCTFAASDTISTPTLVSNLPYFIVPSYNMSIDNVLPYTPIQILVQDSFGSYRFYASEQDLTNGLNFKLNTTFTAPRTTIQPRPF
jgi:hypothetical protein